MKKKFLSLLLIFTMVLSLAAPNVMAAEPNSREALEALVRSAVNSSFVGDATVEADKWLQTQVSNLTKTITEQVANVLTNDSIKNLAVPQLSSLIRTVFSDMGIVLTEDIELEIENIVNELLNSTVVDSIINSNFIQEVIARTIEYALADIIVQLNIPSVAEITALTEAKKEEQIQKITSDLFAMEPGVLGLLNLADTDTKKIGFLQFTTTVKSWKSGGIKTYVDINLAVDSISSLISSGSSGISLPDPSAINYEEIVLNAAERAIKDVFTERVNTLKAQIKTFIEAKIDELKGKAKNELEALKLEAKRALYAELNDLFECALEIHMTLQEVEQELRGKIENIANKVDNATDKLEDILAKIRIVKRALNQITCEDLVDFLNRIEKYLEDKCHKNNDDKPIIIPNPTEWTVTFYNFDGNEILLQTKVADGEYLSQEILIEANSLVVTPNIFTGWYLKESGNPFWNIINPDPIDQDYDVMPWQENFFAKIKDVDIKEGDTYYSPEALLYTDIESNAGSIITIHNITTGKPNGTGDLNAKNTYNVGVTATNGQSMSFTVIVDIAKPYIQVAMTYEDGSAITSELVNGKETSAKTGQNILFTISDNGSVYAGVHHYEYLTQPAHSWVDDGNWIVLNGNAWLVDTEGSFVVKFRAVSNTGAAGGGSNTFAVTIDRSIPIPVTAANITVNFPGVEGVKISHYKDAASGGWKSVDGSFDNTATFQISEPGTNYTIQVQKDTPTHSMSYNFSALTIEMGEDYTFDVPVKPITITGISSACELGLAQADWIYRMSAANVGVPNTFNVFDNGQKYTMNIGRTGYHQLSIPDIDAGQNVWLDIFYNIPVPAGVTNIRIANANWVDTSIWYANYLASDVFTLMKNNTAAKLYFDYAGQSHAVDFMLDGSNPFSLFDYKLTFPGVEGVTLEYYSNLTWTKVVGLFDDEGSFFAPGTKITSLRAVKGGMMYQFDGVKGAGTFDVPVIPLRVFGVNAECNLAVVRSNWVYNYAPVVENVHTLYNVFDNGGPYEVRLQKNGFHTLSKIATRTNYENKDELHVSFDDPFYNVTVPAGYSTIRMQSNGNWIVNPANAGDTILLLKTNQEAKMAFVYNGVQYSDVFFMLDGSDPFKQLAFFHFPGIEGATISYYADLVWTALPNTYDNDAVVFIPQNTTSVRVTKNGMAHTIHSVNTLANRYFDIPVGTITVTGLLADCTLGLVGSNWVYQNVPFAAGSTASFNVFGGQTYEIRMSKQGFHTLSRTLIEAGSNLNLSDCFYNVTVPEGFSVVRMQSNNWIVNPANAGDSIWLIKDEENIRTAKMSNLTYAGQSYSFDFLLDGSDPFANLFVQYHDNQGHSKAEFSRNVTAIPGIVDFPEFYQGTDLHIFVGWSTDPQFSAEALDPNSLPAGFFLPGQPFDTDLPSNLFAVYVAVEEKLPEEVKNKCANFKDLIREIVAHKKALAQRIHSQVVDIKNDVKAGNIKEAIQDIKVVVQEVKTVVNTIANVASKLLKSLFGR